MEHIAIILTYLVCLARRGLGLGCHDAAFRNTGTDEQRDAFPTTLASICGLFGTINLARMQEIHWYHGEHEFVRRKVYIPYRYKSTL